MNIYVGLLVTIISTQIPADKEEKNPEGFKYLTSPKPLIFQEVN